MSLSTAQLMASAEGCGALQRHLSVSRDLTPADSVERSEGTTGVARILPIERGEWPLLSTPCTAIARRPWA
jgi:hypothetical protein